MPPQGTQHKKLPDCVAKQLWEMNEGGEEVVTPLEDLRPGFLCNLDDQIRRMGGHRDGEVMTHNEVSGGMKSSKAARVSLIPADSLRALATHYGQAGGPPGGPKKYEDWNWAKGLDFSLLLDAMMRHWMNFMDPNEPDWDPETGTHEMIVVAWHAMNLAHYCMNVEEYEEFDDRWDGLDVS